MMDAKQLGQEPAHPKITQAVTAVASYPDYDFNGYSGLTKREAFAMAAMQGYIAMFASSEQKIDAIKMATRCAEFSDALLAELAKEQ